VFDAAKMKSGEAQVANFSGIGRNSLFLVWNEGQGWCVFEYLITFVYRNRLVAGSSKTSKRTMPTIRTKTEK
jgi:hypothetical protein